MTASMAVMSALSVMEAGPSVLVVHGLQHNPVPAAGAIELSCVIESENLMHARADRAWNLRYQDELSTAASQWPACIRGSRAPSQLYARGRRTWCHTRSREPTSEDSGGLAR